MAVISRQYEPNNVEWRRVLDDSNPELRIDFCYSLLGFHLESGRLDMLLRFANGGHCRRHRHIASTVTLVLEGEQCLAETQPNGSTKLIVRKKGEYAIAGTDAEAHDEWGGNEGATVLLSMHAPRGVLFEYFDENMENPWTVSIEEFVGSWNDGTIYGWKNQ